MIRSTRRAWLSTPQQQGLTSSKYPGTHELVLQVRTITLQRSILDNAQDLPQKNQGRIGAATTFAPYAPSPIGSSSLHGDNGNKIDSESRQHDLYEKLKEQKASERDVDAHFQGLFQAGQYSQILSTWKQWKDILKSGTHDARLATTRTIVLISHVCTLQANSVPIDETTVMELLLPMRCPRDANRAQILAQDAGLSDEMVDLVRNLIVACEAKDMQPNTTGFLHGLKSLVLKFNGEALQDLYSRARRSKVSLSAETYNKFAEGFLTIGRPQYARQILQDMQEAKIEILPSLWSNLLVHVGRSRDLSAINVMWKDVQQKTTPDTVIYTALIDAYFKCGEVDRALDALRTMSQAQHSLPNSITCNVVVKGLVENKKLAEAIRFVQESAVPAGMKPDITTCNTLLKACLDVGTAEQLKLVMAQIKSLAARDVATYTILASRYSIDDMTVENYTAKVNSVLTQMSREEIRPNAHFYSTVMNNILFSKQERNASPSQAAFRQAQGWLQDMKRSNVPRTVVVYEVLLRALLRTPDVDAAFELWNEMRRDRVLPDAGAYHTMVRGLVETGNLSAAIKVLQKSLESKIKRDNMLLVVLNAAIARQDKTCIEQLFRVLLQAGWSQHSNGVQQALREAAQLVGRSHSLT